MRHVPAATKTCSAVLPPKNGFVTIMMKSNTYIAAYRCFPGYLLEPANGNGIRKCQSSGQWTGVHPVCKSNKCSNTIFMLYAYYVLN